MTDLFLCFCSSGIKSYWLIFFEARVSLGTPRIPWNSRPIFCFSLSGIEIIGMKLHNGLRPSLGRDAGQMQTNKMLPFHSGRLHCSEKTSFFPGITLLLETVTTFTCEPALKGHRIWKENPEKQKQHLQGKAIPYGWSLAVATKLARQPVIHTLQPMFHIMTMTCSAELGHLPRVLTNNVGLFKSF